jgi:hypothetical protein
LNCPNCGTSNPDTATLCANCGRPLQDAVRPPVNSYTPPPPQPSGGYTPPGVAPGTPIPNYLIQSILVTFCCCMPLGIVAIVFAAQVNSKLAMGDIAGAREASSKAKMFSWIGFGIGIVVMVLALLINGIGILAAIRDAAANR